MVSRLLRSTPRYGLHCSEPDKNRLKRNLGYTELSSAKPPQRLDLLYTWSSLSSCHVTIGIVRQPRSRQKRWHYKSFILLKL